MKIIFHSVTAHSIHQFHLPIIKKLQEQQHEVIAVCKNDRFTPLIESKGVRVIESNNSVDGINPLRELKFVWELYSIFKQEKPDIVHHFTPKGVVFGAMASKLAGIKTVCSITGLGNGFTVPFYHPIRLIALFLYYISNFFTDFYIFLNNDDYNFFLKWKITHKKKATLILSSGIDLSIYSYRMAPPLPHPKEKIVFTFLGRFLRNKGVFEFLDAALFVASKYPKAKFLLVGSTGDSPHWLNQDELTSYLKKCPQLTFHPEVIDVKSIYYRTNVLVLPSYREGVPQNVLEAMAYKKPIIVTNVPGCRETTIHGVNGYLCNPYNAQDVAWAMESFLKSPEKVLDMGEKSYELVQKFTVSKVFASTLQIYHNILNRPLLPQKLEALAKTSIKSA